MQAQGWTLLFHACLVQQLRKLNDAAERARARDPDGFCNNANVRTLVALSKLMLHAIPEDPARPDYRQGNTIGPDYRHWRRAKFGGRFRLFFRYHSRAGIIVYAWVNDERSLHQGGEHTDPYAIFKKMLDHGNPPDDWDKLRQSAEHPPGDVFKAIE